MPKCELYYRLQKDKHYEVVREMEGGTQVLAEVAEKYVPEGLSDLFNGNLSFNEALIPHNLRGVEQVRQKIAKESILSLAAEAGVTIKRLVTNLEVTAYIEIVDLRGLTTRVEYTVARLKPEELNPFMARVTYDPALRKEILDQTMDQASVHHFSMGWKNAREELDHMVTSDKYGLAMDFNPTEKALSRAVKLEVIDSGVQLGSKQIADRMVEIETKMHSHLFQKDPIASVARIPLTGARRQDEIAAMRQLFQQTRGNRTFDYSRFFSITDLADISNADIGRMLSYLKREHDVVFHHSANVSINPQGFLVTDLQLVSKRAHSASVKLVEAIPEEKLLKWYEMDWQLLGEEVTGFETVRNALSHVGGCKVYKDYFGIKWYK